MEPLIKYSGSKRYLGKVVSQLLPEYDRVFIPFCGGATLIDSFHGETYCSDNSKPLIDMFNLVKSCPERVVEHYSSLWPEYDYYEVRDRFNKLRHPLDFLFLSRTCYNGLIRFNGKGEFNTPYHFGRRGIKPEKFEKIVFSWHERIKNVEFKREDYKDTFKLVGENDLVILDPPYINIKGMYKGVFDFPRFIEDIKNLPFNCKIILFIDGDYSKYKELDQIFCKKELIKIKSSFKALKNKEDNKYYENILMNYGE